MVQLTFKSPGVGLNQINLTAPGNVVPVGVPAGVVGTAQQGKAFVPLTFASLDDFKIQFGDAGNAGLFGPIAVAEWLRNAQSVCFLRVLGIGLGTKRETSGDNAGRVASAGYVVGAELPDADGSPDGNPWANAGGPLGRVHFLGAYMSESVGSTIFSEAGRQGTSAAVPTLRGVLMAPSGVVPRLAAAGEAGPAANLIAGGGTSGGITGSVTLLDGTTAKEEFVMFLNGHKGLDANYPRVITASFDPTAANYFANVMNGDPTKIQEAGHLLYARYDIHSQWAIVTGTNVITDAVAGNTQPVAFVASGALARNSGSAVAPSFENFEDRFRTPQSTYVISQKFGGSHKNLFKIHALSDGAFSNKRLKISIASIAKSNIDTDRYGRFDLLVRDWNDTDEDKVVFERYAGLSLDPGNDRYIARVIGDMNIYFDFDKNTGSQKLRVDGNFENRSNLIRVEVTDEVDDKEIDATALPIGFRGPRHLVLSGSSPLASNDDTDSLAISGVLNNIAEPPVPYRRTVAVGSGQKKDFNQDFYWGVHFETQISVAEPNLGKRPEPSVGTFTQYYPDYQTSWQNFLVGDNEGALDTAENGILDADRYNNNLFSLENIQVVTGSDGLATTKNLADWTYKRAGGIVVNETAKTRAFSADTDFASLAVRNVAKFSFFLQGGYDGVNVFDADATALNDKAINEEMNFVARGQNNGPTVKAYTKALELMGNTSEVDVKLLAIPGIRHEVVTDQIIDTTETRFDAMAIVDIEERDSLNNVVTSSTEQNQSVGNTANAFLSRAIDSSFAAAYYPDVIMIDPFSGLESRVPPSVAAIGAMSLNDSIARPWFAPAGYKRGILETTVSTAVNLSRANMDDLYEVDINPITSFPGSEGVVVWGQKTLKRAQSALDRINVRRLLIEIRREVRAVSNSILFEPNREETLSRFSALVNPILQRVQDQQGLDGFRVIIDSTTTSQADIENNTIRGKIFLQPTKVAEFIDLDFVITNQGGLGG